MGGGKGDALWIGILFLEEPVVQVLRDGLALVVQVVDVSRTRVRYLGLGEGGVRGRRGQRLEEEGEVLQG